VVTAVAWLAAAATVSCAAGDAIVVTRGLEYVDSQRLDVHASDDADGDRPVVVLMHGAGLDRVAYEAFATRLAERGAVVFNADWDVLAPSTATALGHVACAVGYARSHASEYGGDPARLVLAGHSTAAAYVGRVAAAGDELEGDCALARSALPEALAILAPASIPGGSPWHPSLMGRNPGLSIGVVHGADDAVAPLSRGRRTHDILVEAGYDVTFEVVPGGHYDLVMIDGPGEPEDQAVETTIATILALVAD
jgi:predicted esterase